MAVTLRTRTIQEPQELGQVLDVVEKLVAIAVDGKTTGDKLSELSALLPLLVTAGEGVGGLGEEIKDVHVYQAAGAFSGRIAQVLITKQPVA